MEWKDEYYELLLPTAKKQAKNLSQKTSMPNFFYQDLLAEAVYQMPRIVKRWKPEKGNLKTFYTSSISGALKNYLRDNRIIKLERKYSDTYNAFYSLKKKQPLLKDSEILKQLELTKEQFEEIRIMVNTPTTSLDKYNKYETPDYFLQEAIKSLHSIATLKEIEALVALYVEKTPITDVCKIYGLSKTSLNLLTKKIKKNCKFYMNDDD